MNRDSEASAGEELLLQLDDALELARPGGHTHAELTLAYNAVEEAIALADLQRARAITHHALGHCLAVAA
ncbi:MAG: hypothetical protein ACREO0_05515 [Pseudoxanthomonas sp.]